MRCKTVVFLMLTGLALVLSQQAVAGIITASSCSAADVQAAINAAVTGDTIVVPGGECSWSTTVSIPNSKSITVSGGGVTTISGLFSLSANATAGSRITGFTFTKGLAIGTGGGACGTSCAPFRIDHNTFVSSSQVTFVQTSNNAPGLIDNNTFVGGGASEMIHNFGTGAGNTSGWLDSVTPGSDKMLFVEDNTFTFSATGSPAYFYGTSALQSYYGARTVFRHNYLTMCQVDQHGTPGNIGARWWEIYENTFNVIPNGNQSSFMDIRAGTGVIFNNHKVGAPNLGSGVINLREEDTTDPSPCPANTYPLLWAIGRGISSVSTPACGSDLTSSPAYVWANDSTMPVNGQNTAYVQPNRDYFVSATQPASLLRRELSSDTATTTYAYVPYIYPHPLQKATPATPASVTVIVN